MQMHQIKRNKANRKPKQVGRGGKRGKTSGKGTKGQNARAGRKKRPEMRDIIKRFPKLRGRGRNYLKSIQKKPVTVSTTLLDETFASASPINPKSLMEKGILRGNKQDVRIKIVLGAPVTKKYIVSGCEVSEGARAAIEKAGGSVE